MAEPAASGGKLKTLTEVAKITNISMPTLQRYKKTYQDRIPSVGSGRSQRYPEEAIAVFQQLKKENVGKRGRPRKTAGAAPAKKAAAPKKARKAAPKKRAARKAAPKKAAKRGRPRKAAAATTGLLTLTEIGKLTKISYPTLLRYVKNHLKEIPHQGTGRARRYKPEAVEVFKRLRAESPRGRAASKAKRRGPGRPPKKVAARRGRPPKKAAAAKKGRPGRKPAEPAVADLKARIKALEATNKKLARAIAKVEKALAKPIKLVAARK